MRWKSPHPDLDIPTDVTTWQWIFETNRYSSAMSSRSKVGAYVDAVTGQRLDFFQVKDKATWLSTALIREYGLAPGHTVSIFSTNTIWYPVAMWATVRAGGRINGASPAYSVDEMEHCLRTAESRYLMTHANTLDVAVEAADRVGLARSRIFLLEGRHSAFKSISDLIALGRGDGFGEPEAAYSIPPSHSNKSICGFLNFSSGTTGLPKAVMLSHHNIIAQCHQLRQLQVLPTPIDDDDDEGDPDDDAERGRYRVLAVMPLFHITGLVRFCNYPALLNGDSIMLPAFTVQGMVSAILRYRIPELILVPAILVRMVRDSEVVTGPVLERLRRVVKRWSSGSAPTSPEVIELLRRRFPSTGFRQGYGATESTACISCHPPTHYDYRYAHTGGLLVANTEAKVLSLSGGAREPGPGETGEICARGPQIAMGYLGNDEATREAFDSEGFLHTGDVGFIDDEGLLHIVDRIKEMIKVKGQQVAPAELEDLLLGQEEVEDVAVLGITDPYAGERPKAYVVRKKGNDSEGAEAEEALGRRLLALVKARKVRYKWIKEIEFVDSVPKSPTGKLLRRLLKAREREEDRVKGVVVRDEEAAKARL